MSCHDTFPEAEHLLKDKIQKLLTRHYPAGALQIEIVRGEWMVAYKFPRGNDQYYSQAGHPHLNAALDNVAQQLDDLEKSLPPIEL